MAGTDALMSSRASKVSREDCAIDIMEEEACRRSRYRSLRFHIRVPADHIVQYTSTHPTISRSSSCLTSASVLSRAAESQRETSEVKVKEYGAQEALVDLLHL